jgi:hypothetical protein
MMVFHSRSLSPTGELNVILFFSIFLISLFLCELIKKGRKR